MGMYTEFVMAIELKSKVPNEVIETLKYMMDFAERPDNIPLHALFSTERWPRMLCSSSYSFDGDSKSTIIYDKVRAAYQLTIRCSLKNYYSEIEKFLDWVSPYSYTEGFVGYSRYEEDDNPVLIYFDNGKVRRSKHDD
jgi:hypothetical protein